MALSIEGSGRDRGGGAWHAPCVSVGWAASVPPISRREAGMTSRNPDDSPTPIARQGGGSLRTILFIAVIALGVVAILLMVFGWGAAA